MSLLFVRISNFLEKNKYLTKGLARNYLIFLTLFLLGFFILNYTLSVSANDSTLVNITASADSWVESYPLYDYNYGSDSILHVRNTTDITKRQTFLRFDLSGLPADADITSATLNMYPMWKSDPRTVFLSVYSVSNDSWVEGNGNDTGCNANETGTCGASLSEYAISWNHKPSIGQLINTTSVSVDKWASWDVTNAVESEYNNDKNLTLALSFSGSYQYHHKDFYSSEYNDTNFIPYLEITYTEFICVNDTDCDDSNLCTVDSCISSKCVHTPVTSETVCNDQIDNDCDGLTDCADFDCEGNQYCPKSCNGLDICTWDKVLPLGSENCCGCQLDYNTYWPINTETSATCTFNGDALQQNHLYISIDNDIINCTLNGNLVFSNQQHEGCAPADPKDGYTVNITPVSGSNTIICYLRDRGNMTYFDACIIGAPQVCGNGIVEGNEQCDPGANNPNDCCNATCMFETSQYICRPTVGDCDVAEQCNGTSATCPTDTFKPAQADCGICKECDGFGYCNLMPSDDADCGTIDCDELDTTCRDYQDLTSNRCKAFGVCKSSNTDDCTDYMNASLSTSCDIDNDVCTIDHCDGSGTCVFLQYLDCSDGNECTQDLCNYQTGCHNPPEQNGTECGSARDCPSDACNGFKTEFYPNDGHDYCNGSGTCIQYSCAMERSYCTDNDANDGVDSLMCGAACDQNSDCQGYCDGNTRYFNGNCELGSCSCSYDSESCGIDTRSCTAGTNCQCDNGQWMCDTDNNKSCDRGCTAGICNQSCTPPACDRSRQGTDSDGDGYDDECEECDNTYCRQIPTTEICNNGCDDDCDGLTDCADFDCEGNQDCYSRSCGTSLDICKWNKVLPLGSPDCCGCGLGYNTYWSLNTQTIATCTFNDNTLLQHHLYISIDNDIINCTLNGNVVFSNQQHEGCAPVDPRDPMNGYTINITPVSGSNTIVCYMKDRGSMSHFDACVLRAKCFSDQDCGLCNKCVNNTCVYQSASEDLKNECQSGDCASGFCNGAGTCYFNSSTTVCRASAGDCDLAENCDGSTKDCPTDTKSTALCRQAIDQCDVSEYCNGINNDCPTDSKAPLSTPCDNDLWCSATDHCDGNGTCVQLTARDCSQNNINGIATCDNIPDQIHATWDFRNAFTGQCVEDGNNQGHCTTGDQTITHTCNQVNCSAQCDSTHPCANTCDVNTWYYDGQCQGDCTCSYSQQNCDDQNVCTDDTCDPQKGCVHTNNTNSCDDGNVCTINDVCSQGNCVGTPVTTETSCNDGTDNDCDGLIDCADFDCAGITPCNYTRPCGGIDIVDICAWNKVLPLGSPNCCGCQLGYNTYWPINTQNTATCTFNGDLAESQNLYISINNDIINCTLNNNLIFQNTQHEGCAPVDPRVGGYIVDLDQYVQSGQNTLVCNMNDRGNMTHFDACVIEKQCFDNNDCGTCQKCVNNNCVYQSASEDLKNECQSGDCTSGFCNGTGTCDLSPATTVCRPSTDVCDVEEKCTGSSTTCPADTKAPLSTPCDDGQFCTVDHCDGSGNCVNWKPYNCSSWDLPTIATCNYNPDNNPKTWDYSPLVPGVCNETGDKCEYGTQVPTHTCADSDNIDGVVYYNSGTQTCAAECDGAGVECQPKLEGDYCYYQGQCNTDPTECTCSWTKDGYCPESGTNNVTHCFWGVRSCDSNGCTLNVTPMGQYDKCNSTGVYHIQIHVENPTTQNITFCHNETITVQAWGSEGISTVILEDTQNFEQYDFGIPTSPVEPGFINVTIYTLYSTSQGYGWNNTPLDGRDRGSGTYLTRDLIFDTEDREFKVDIPNGTYYLTIYLGDMDYAHDNMDVTAEGTVLADDANTSAGEIKTFTSKVTVSDGQLNVIFHDDDGSNPHWTSNGLVIKQTIPYVMEHISGNNYSVTFHPDPGQHSIRFIVNDTLGFVNDTVTGSYYVNSAPSIAGVNITPTNPKTNDILNCIPYGWYDPDGDLPQYYYQWYDDGSLIVNAMNSTFNCSNPGCDKGNVIYCEVTPYDSYQNGTSVNGSVVIGNLPPSTPGLSPSTGTFHNIVYINCSGSTDPDGDTITYSIQTDVNGSWQNIVTNDSDGYYIWDISGYPCKNNVDLRCRAFDGTAYSSWKNPTGKINIDNCGPTVILVDPTPANGVRLLNNWIFVNAIAVDNQSDVDTCTLEWNGVNETMNKSTYDIIVDDGDTGYTDTGWVYYSGQGYGNDVRYISAGTGSQTATWTPSLPVTSETEVYVSWTTHPNRATNAKYTVYHDKGFNTTVINQELLADQNTTGSSGQWSGWYYLGKYHLNSGNVTLNDNADEYVIADAVKFSIETCALNKTTVDCGNYTYKVYANDTLGNEGSSDYRHNKENKKPSVPVLLSPLNATLTNHVITLYDWINSTDDENDTITYDLLIDSDSGFISPLITKIGLPDSNYILNLTEVTLLNNNGIYYWKVRAFDGYEYSSYSSFWMFSIDLTPPRVENSSVMNITECNDLDITIDAWDESGISTVIVEDIYIINQSYKMNNTGNNTYKVTIHPCRGMHNLRYYVNDTVGNVNDGVTDWFNVTTTTPRVVSVLITPSFIYNNSIYVGTGNIQFNITFNKLMNTSVPLSVNYGNVTPYNTYKVIGNWTSPKTWSGYSTVNLSTPNGNYTLNISGGMDKSCNSFSGEMMVENTSTWFIIDTNEPRVVSAIINPSVTANNITCVKDGNITFNITFGPNMNTSVNPIVTFGRYQPYNTYFVNGSWFDSTTWVGYFNITSSMTNAWYTLSISGAKDLLGRTMTTNTSYGFNVDTKPPIILKIYTSNITKEENETVTIEVKDYDCVGYEECGLDTVLVELNGSVNYTMELGYYTSEGGGYYVYYYIIPNTSYGVGNQYLRFYVNDTAGNMNSNATASFFVNNTIPKVGGRIAFLCRNNPVGNTCYDDIEDTLISWLRSQNWTVDVKIYNKWNKTNLASYDLIMCSDERYACDYATKSTTDVSYMHKVNKKAFVEISDDSLLRAAKNFGYVSYTGGSTRYNINNLYVTISHPITTGYFGNMQIFSTNKTMTTISDNMLSGVKDIADAGVENRKTTLFSKDQPGRFAYVGWFYRDFSGLNAIGNTTLARAINWAQCGNAKGCS